MRVRHRRTVRVRDPRRVDTLEGTVIGGRGRRTINAFSSLGEIVGKRPQWVTGTLYVLVAGNGSDGAGGLNGASSGVGGSSLGDITGLASASDTPSITIVYSAPEVPPVDPGCTGFLCLDFGSLAPLS
ncbi:hypothetical protein ONR57_14065 [Hoyosella sp. YIM 151337]|uniref:hypothetical protein n=1 Tax=Hoyosella sp. YIM 151337 TaxID=2992742 RepID=UPI0022358391|nr:hypothetical protein [Hoyosella sp. YIM 151337]MCW4354430.1 hypothetical protein [Hoyosella sp. YIM 151337]